MNYYEAASTAAAEVPAVKWSRGGLQNLMTCPACGETAAKVPTFERGDDSGLMPDLWRIHRCARCRSVYLNPRPSADSLPAAYVDYLTHDVVESETLFTSNAVEWALIRDYLKWRFGLQTTRRVMPGGRSIFRLYEPWRLKLDRFGRHLTREVIPVPGKLLDVGCGNGEFLKLARAMGWVTIGCDPDPKVVDLCRERGLDVRVGGVEAFAGDASVFDAITLNQVIEHVIDPQQLLASCYRLLKPSGMVWIGLPNPAAIGEAVFQACWSGLHPPYHLCLPTQAVLRDWLKAAGFQQIGFMRRGAHAGADWRNSSEIGRRYGLHVPGSMVRIISRIGSDAISTISSRWGEETVAVAWKSARK